MLRWLLLSARRSDMTYKRRVTGRPRGTTDEIIRWAAHKHGMREDVFRAVAKPIPSSSSSIT